MLESELNDTQNNDSTEGGSGAGELNPSAPAVPAAVFQPPQVVFQPPAVQPEPPGTQPRSGVLPPGRNSGRCRSGRRHRR